MRIFRKTVAAEIPKTCAELVREYAGDIESKAFIFCESKSTLSFERALCAAFGGSFSVEVTSFSRYVSQRLDNVNYVGKTQASMLIAAILSENADKLTRLKSNSFSSAVNIFELISQLRSAKISPDDLDEIIEEEGSALTYKLRDIRLIYSLYERELSSRGFVDDGKIMELLPDMMENDERLKGSKVIVAGIGNFTAQTLDAVKTLERLCDLDCVVLSYDGDSALNESLVKLKKLFPSATVVEDEKVYSVAVTQIKERLYADERMSECGIACDNVKVVETSDPYAEARFVAKTIKKEMLANDRRLKDFAVACPDVAAYEDAFLSAFADHGLVLFADRTYAISKHPSADLFAAIAEFKRFGARTDTAQRIVSSSVAFSAEEADVFNEYTAENVLPRYWIKKPFKTAEAESVRAKLALVFDSMPLTASVSAFAEKTVAVFERLGVGSGVKDAAAKLSDIGEDAAAKFLLQGHEAFVRILGDAVKLSGAKVLLLKEFYDLVFSSLAACEISVLPQHSDNVFLGDYKSVKNAACPILFCVGMNGDTPFAKKDDALLNDRELSKLESFRLVVEPKISIVNRRERELVAATLCSFSEKLFVSYSLSAFDGSKTERSEIVDYLINAFSDGNGSSPLILPDQNGIFGDNGLIDDYLSLGSGLKRFIMSVDGFKNKQISDLSTASAFLSALELGGTERAAATNACKEDNLFRPDPELSYVGKISPSLTESFFTCPYKAFMEKILGVKEPRSASVGATEPGLILHSVMEGFAPRVDGLEEDGVRKVAEDIFDEVVSRPEYSRYLERKSGGFFLAELKKEAVKCCNRLYRSFKNSDFKLLGAEVGFGDGEVLPAIELESGQRLRGVIDRVDTLKTSDGTSYARVVDYKSGAYVSDKASVKNLYYGKNVQLYLYMNAVVAAGYEPAAVHYLELNDDFKNPDDTKIYSGYVVNDEKILKSVDHAFENGGKSPDYGSAKPNTENVCSKSELNDLIAYSKLVTESAAREMRDGCFFATPTEGACGYCKYKGSCRFDGAESDNLRETQRVRRADITEAIGGNGNEQN